MFTSFAATCIRLLCRYAMLEEAPDCMPMQTPQMARIPLTHQPAVTNVLHSLDVQSIEGVQDVHNVKDAQMEEDVRRCEDMHECAWFSWRPKCAQRFVRFSLVLALLCLAAFAEVSYIT